MRGPLPLIALLTAFLNPAPLLAGPAVPPLENYGWGLPVQASTYAREIDLGLWIIHIAMVLIFVLWGIFFTYLLVRYRHRAGTAARGGDSHESLMGLMPDFAVMVFEIGLILFYAIPSWSRIKMAVPEGPETVQLEVVAEQFAWNVHYPGADGRFGRRDAKFIHFANPLGLDPDDPAGADDVATANEMHLPVDRPAVLQLTSKDVIHSFFVPEFRIKQDAVPGMKIPVWMQPNRAGVYEIGCAQLCGFGHSLMRGAVVVETAEEFAAWLQTRAPKKPKAETGDW